MQNYMKRNWRNWRNWTKCSIPSKCQIRDVRFAKFSYASISTCVRVICYDFRTTFACKKRAFFHENFNIKTPVMLSLNGKTLVHRNYPSFWTVFYFIYHRSWGPNICFWREERDNLQVRPRIGLILMVFDAFPCVRPYATIHAGGSVRSMLKHNACFGHRAV